MISSFREPVSGISHLLGAVVAAAGMILLLELTRDDPQLQIAIFIYTASTIITFSASAVMHLYPGSANTIKWLIRIDHAAIYLMIAGTYTPLCIAYLDGSAQVIVLGTVWLMAIGGIMWKLMRWEQDSLGSTLYYVVMGSLIVLALPEMMQHAPQLIMWLILGGGIVYLVGAGVFATRRPNINEWWGWHEIWHLFVLGGFALHFAAIALIVV